MYKIKKSLDGSVERYKAQLVAWGFLKQYEQDYDEKFSRVTKFTIVRVILTFTASKEWKLWQIKSRDLYELTESTWELNSFGVCIQANKEHWWQLLSI